MTAGVVRGLVGGYGRTGAGVGVAATGSGPHQARPAPPVTPSPPSAGRRRSLRTRSATASMVADTPAYAISTSRKPCPSKDQ